MILSETLLWSAAAFFLLGYAGVSMLILLWTLYLLNRWKDRRKRTMP